MSIPLTITLIYSVSEWHWTLIDDTGEPVEAGHHMDYLEACRNAYEAFCKIEGNY